MLLRCVGTSGRERHIEHRDPPSFAAFSTAAATSLETIKSATEIFLPPDCGGSVERPPGFFPRVCMTFAELGQDCWRPSPSAAPGECGLRWRHRACRYRGRSKPKPRRSTPVRRNRAQARVQNRLLERGDVVGHRRSGDRRSRHRVLPDERLFLGTSGAEVARRGPMSRCVSLNQALANASANSFGILEEALGDLLGRPGSIFQRQGRWSA